MPFWRLLCSINALLRPCRSSYCWSIIHCVSTGTVMDEQRLAITLLGRCYPPIALDQLRPQCPTRQNGMHAVGALSCARSRFEGHSTRTIGVPTGIRRCWLSAPAASCCIFCPTPAHHPLQQARVPSPFGNQGEAIRLACMRGKSSVNCHDPK